MGRPEIDGLFRLGIEINRYMLIDSRVKNSRGESAAQFREIQESFLKPRAFSHMFML